jgi:hypothetical protein
VSIRTESIEYPSNDGAEPWRTRPGRNLPALSRRLTTKSWPVVSPGKSKYRASGAGPRSVPAPESLFFLVLCPADRIRVEDQIMATIEKPAAITADPEVEVAVDRVLKGIRDPEAMRREAERMDRMREEMRLRVGNVDLAVPLIRETRDEE